jgi:hypothetical protein
VEQPAVSGSVTLGQGQHTLGHAGCGSNLLPPLVASHPAAWSGQPSLVKGVVCTYVGKGAVQRRTGLLVPVKGSGTPC